MNDLVIRYGISGNLKFLAVISGIYLFGMSAGVSIYQAVAGKYGSVFFYVGLAGAVIGIILILAFVLTNSKPVIVIDNDRFHIHLPKQRIDGSIEWDNVKQLGIGLSYVTMSVNDGKNYKMDLENLKYSDLRAIKTKLIEVCEAKSIPYNNV